MIAVALFIGTAEAGVYFAANRLAQLLAFFVTSQNIVIGIVTVSTVSVVVVQFVVTVFNTMNH